MSKDWTHETAINVMEAEITALRAEIERLRAALRKIASNNQQRSNCFCGACIQARAARAALKEDGDE